MFSEGSFPSVDDRVKRPSVDDVKRPSIDDGVQSPSVNDCVQNPSVDDHLRHPSVEDHVQNPSIDDRVRHPSVDDKENDARAIPPWTHSNSISERKNVVPKSEVMRSKPINFLRTFWKNVSTGSSKFRS